MRGSGGELIADVWEWISRRTIQANLSNSELALLKRLFELNFVFGPARHLYDLSRTVPIVKFLVLVHYVIEKILKGRTSLSRNR